MYVGRLHCSLHRGRLFDWRPQALSPFARANPPALVVYCTVASRPPTKTRANIHLLRLSPTVAVCCNRLQTGRHKRAVANEVGSLAQVEIKINNSGAAMFCTAKNKK